MAVLLGAGLAIAGSPSATANSPAQPVPNQVTDLETRGNKPQAANQSAAAGNRAYFVITAPADVAAGKTAVTGNGGTVFASYDPIGVIVAHSTAADFATKVRAVAGVQQVGATRTTDVPAAAANPAIPPSPSQTTPTANEISRYDMVNIGADKAWDVNQGSAAVTVGVLDTGVDDQHYDLKANFDAGKSASCAYGKLDTREGAWRPVGDHGTHVAGTIAAAKNGKGAIGVAPGVKVSSVRIAENPSGLFFPENTVCAFVFAGDKGIKVTNNSYYTDPWLFNCPSDRDQAAILEGVKRAAAYAEGKGVLNVAAAGNENYNLAGKSTDNTSPDDSTPVNRTVTNDCLSLPTELPGVVVVSALTSSNGKSSYSNFGTNKVHIAAPGDSVYSTVPGGGYGQKSGTSMASPHVAGVAALLASVNPSATVADLRGKLAAQAEDQACPSDSRCTGGTTKNSFYGEGRVDALEAVNGTTPPGGKTFTNDTNVDIPDAGAAVTSSVVVTGITGNAPSTLKVGVDIKHPYRGDLVIDLVAPDGTTYRLKNSSGDSADNVITTFPVDASSEVANGTWKLKVQDVASADVGYIDTWSLTF
ncbi:S8 family serine peptidase [Lentzea tibetensis]|uniref:S8 family serine peptidase n=1 Tax=Lentzea tibetensis TaxID=2591470 RepID=A0A563F1Y8_9PSEU|nr:S8 family serine peptidase [Lentzea tibetensis]